MKIMKRSVLCLILLSLFAPCDARAQSQTSQADVKALVTEYVAAFNTKDVTRLRALYYPKSLACITRANKDFYDAELASEWRDPIPANYTFAVSAVNESNLAALESFQRLPVKATQDLQIDYQQGDDAGSLTLWLVRDNGRLYIDWPCATEQTVKRYRDEAPANARLLAHYKVLAATIEEPLRSQLVALLREHKTGEATKRYKEASGQDYKTAISVIDQLGHQPRQ